MTVKDFLAIVELRTKIVSVSSCILGFLFAYADGHPLHPLAAALLFASALFVDMGTTAFNSYFDWLRGTDNGDWNREADKVLVHSEVKASAAIGSAIVLFALAALLGLILAFLSGFWLLPVGALCMVVGFLYSGGPRPISFTPIGEPVAGGLLGSVLFAIAYSVAAGGGTGPGLLVAAPQGLFVAGILAANNACDIEGDRAVGRRTLAVLLGKRAAPLVLVFYLLAAFVSALVLIAFGAIGGSPSASTFLTLAAGGLLSAAILVRAGRFGFSHERKSAVMGSVSLAFLVHSITLAIISIA